MEMEGKQLIVTLIGKRYMQKINLPKVQVGNYWLSDKSREKEIRLINIRGENGNWHAYSNNFLKIIKAEAVEKHKRTLSNEYKSEEILHKVTLSEHSMYYVSLGNNGELFLLYCSPSSENDFMHLNLTEGTEILIGSRLDNDITYNNPLVKGRQAKLFFNNGKFTIENYDQDYGVFVNNIPVYDDSKTLYNGDIIFIMGLKIVIMGKSLFVNNPLNRVRYNIKRLRIEKPIWDFSNLKQEDEENVELYSEKDYFSRAPRITNVIESEKVKIDPPPTMQNKEDMPLMLVLGSTLSMGIIMILSIVRSIDGLTSGTASTKSTIFSIIISAVMLIGILLFPILNQMYSRKQKKKYEEKRQIKYKEYIDLKAKKIDQIMDKQRNILFENYLTDEECAEIILKKNSRLWERRIEDEDFLTIRTGIGDVPLKINIQYPEESFAMEDDNLVEILNGIANKSKILKEAPITVPLVEKNVSALIVKEDKSLIEKFIQSMILQLITFHSYEDLKLVFFLKDDKSEMWEYIKMLPHVWNNTKQVRFFAKDYTEMKEISKYLELEIENRKRYNDKVDYKSFLPYYLIITDDYKSIKNLKIITEVLEAKNNLGFSIFCITNNITQLPNECKTFICLEDENGTIFDNEISSKSQKEFKFDPSTTFFFDKLCQALANIPIKNVTVETNMLPDNYSFLEMYDVGRIEQLNVLQRWKENDSTLSLQAPIGIDSTGMPIVLDIHEKFHGPHGLIAGSTGSGKSELIITYILSLAVNYSPNDVNFILIDYKGGGLAGAFQKREIKLPHLVGTITNIETVGLQRSLDSIQSELRRRQVAFNEVRNQIEEGTIDIYKYQQLYHEGIVKKPIPHLLIICDEFAELKQQQEEFMNELISVARIGRSLGVHLILATQKPAGIVNEQIRSNSKFGICLKVQSRQDSIDVIKRPDAADLKQIGRFYLQVGNNEYFVLGQSAYAGVPYIPTDFMKKKIDNSIKFITNTGTVIKEADNMKNKIINRNGEQLTNIVRYLYNLARDEKIKTKQLWLDSIPENIYIEDIKKKYNVKSKENNIETVIGEYDDPYNQRQGVAKINLSKDGNVIIYGNAESGKETLLSTMTYDLITRYKSNEVQLYILDFGSEALKIFKPAPHVGDVIFINDTEKIDRFFEMMQKEMKNRKTILSDFNGDYKLYMKENKSPLPMIIIMLNNYEAFSENYENLYEDTMLTLTREGIKYGINFVITTSTFHDIRYRLTQNFKQKIALQLNNEDDYLNIMEGIKKKRPSHIFGRGLIKLEDIYEFQTAKICESGKYNIVIKNTIENITKTNETIAKNVPILPEMVSLEDVKYKLKDIHSVPIGLSEKTLNPYVYDFEKNILNVITAKSIETVARFIVQLLEELINIKNNILIVLDFERMLQTNKATINENFEQLMQALEQKKNTLCLILGLDRFLTDIQGGEQKFNEIIKKAEDNGNCEFIIVDNYAKLKMHEFKSWYKQYIFKDTGIWIGKGISDQYVINIDVARNKLKNNCGDSFGYVIKQGNPVLVKLIGIEDREEENE